MKTRRAVWALTLPIVGLAGCGGPRAGADGGDAAVDDGSIEQAPVTVEFGPPVRVNDEPIGDTSTQREPTVAIDRSGNVYVAFVDYPVGGGPNSAHIRFARSTDRGATFSPTSAADCGLPNCSDPVLAVDSADRVFLLSGVSLDPGPPLVRQAYLSRLDNLPGRPPAAVQVSDDPSATTEDRGWLAIGPGDELYVTWFRGYFSSTPELRATGSLDHGASFSPSVPVGGPAPEGVPLDSAVAVEPTGAVDVVYPVGDNSSATGTRVPRALYFVRSTDGARTFSVPLRLPSPVAPNVTYSEIGAFVNLPTIAVTPAGTIVVAWAAQNPSLMDDVDIAVTRSLDQGRSFGSVVLVNDDRAPGIHLFPWLAVDETNVVHAVWLDSRGYSGGPPWSVYASWSNDGAASFAPNRALTTQLFGASFGQSSPDSITDFYSIAARGSFVYPAWSDTRLGDADVWVAAGARMP